MKELFVTGLLILAGGIGTLAFGITGQNEYNKLSEIYRMLTETDYKMLIGIGAGLSTLGVGMIIGSIVWKRK